MFNELEFTHRDGFLCIGQKFWSFDQFSRGSVTLLSSNNVVGVVPNNVLPE